MSAEREKFSIEPETLPVNGATVLRFLLKGRFTLSQEPDAMKILLEHVRDNIRGVIVDMTDVAYVDSYGLGVLAAFSIKMTKRKIPLCLVGVGQAIEVLFRASKVDDFFLTFETLDDALRHIQQSLQTG